MAVLGILLVLGIAFTLNAPEKPSRSAHALTEERWANFQKHGQALTNEEMNGPQTDWRWEWSGPFWQAWFLLFGVAAVYRILAQREEIALAFKRQRTRSSKDMPPERSRSDEKKEGGGSKSMIPGVGKIITETAAEVAAETVTEVATKAARKIFKK